MLYIGFGITVFFVLLAILAPLISPYHFDQYKSGDHRFPQLAAPSHDHLIGTTVQSTDVLSRVIWGAQTELKVVIISLVFALSVGVPLGLLSGYFGGKLDRGLVLVMDALYAFPFLLLAIVIAFLLSNSIGKGVLTAAIAISAAYVPLYFRVVRNQVIALREESYVEAARALGAKPFTIIRKYVFYNVVQNVPPIATLNAADAILVLTALGFLGYGIQPTDAAEWGYDISRAVSDTASGIWWTGLFPGRRDRPPRHRADARRRGPERDDEPGAPEAAVREGRRSPTRSASRRRSTWAPRSDSLRPRPAGPLRHHARHRARGRPTSRSTSTPARSLGLVGESGCGKSTLGRGVLGLLPEGAEADGEVLYGGRNLVGMSPQGSPQAARARPRPDLPGADDAAEPAPADRGPLQGDAGGARAAI